MEHLLQIIADKVVPVHHQQWPGSHHRQAGSGGVQNRRDEAGQPHGTEIDILSPQPLGLHGPVQMPLIAPEFPTGVLHEGFTDFAGGAAEPDRIQNCAR